MRFPVSLRGATGIAFAQVGSGPQPVHRDNRSLSRATYLQAVRPGRMCRCRSPAGGGWKRPDVPGGTEHQDPSFANTMNGSAGEAGGGAAPLHRRRWCWQTHAKPARAALCVTSFRYDLDRDEGGATGIRPKSVHSLKLGVGRLVDPARRVGGGGRHDGLRRHRPRFSAPYLFGTAVPTGRPPQRRRRLRHQTIACNDGHLSLTGFKNTVTVTGHWRQPSQSETPAITSPLIAPTAIDVSRAIGIPSPTTRGSPRINQHRRQHRSNKADR